MSLLLLLRNWALGAVPTPPTSPPGRKVANAVDVRYLQAVDSRALFASNVRTIVESPA